MRDDGTVGAGLLHGDIAADLPRGHDAGPHPWPAFEHKPSCATPGERLTPARHAPGVWIVRCPSCGAVGVRDDDNRQRRSVR